MILEKQTEVVVVEEGIENDAIGMSLDLDSANMLMQMLSKNLYSDSVGSTIRETCSNALDSHRRAGVNLPIIVSLELDTKTYNYSFSVEDFGLGLDADDVANIISKYGKSTKRNSATELGMFGLGFKAPLAYTSSFYFICRKNGVERKYMMHESEDSNSINLLHETSTIERNGVKVIIPIKSYDRFSFENKIYEQLAYFENVHVLIYGKVKEFKIFRHELFQCSDMVKDNHVHLCLDNVYYPLEFSKVGIHTLQFPIGIRLTLSDGVYPTPNREAIRYTDVAKSVILDRLKQIADYFVTKYNKEISNADVKHIGNVRDHFMNSRNISILNDGNYFNAEELFKYSKIPVECPKMSKYPLLNMKAITEDIVQLFRDYDVATNFLAKRMTTGNGVFLMTDLINAPHGTYILRDVPRIPEAVKSHLRMTNKSFTKVIAPNSFKRKLHDRRSGYFSILGLRDVPKSEWRNTIIQFEEFRKDILSTFFTPLSSIVVPNDNIDAVTGQKIPRKQRMKLAEGEFSAKMGRKKSNYPYSPTFDKAAPIQLKNFHRRSKLFIYGKEESKELLENIFKYDSDKFEIALVGQRAYASLENTNIHNLISVEKFMEGSHISFKRIATAALINQKIVHAYVNGKRILKCNYFMKSIIASLGEDLEILNSYYAKHSNSFYSDHDFEKSLIEIAEKNSLFDYSVMSSFDRVVAFIEDNKWFAPLSIKLSSSDADEGFKELVIMGLKYKKYRLNAEHYAPAVKQEKQDIETLEDDFIA